MMAIRQSSRSGDRHAIWACLSMFPDDSMNCLLRILQMLEMGRNQILNSKEHISGFIKMATAKMSDYICENMF